MKPDWPILVGRVLLMRQCAERDGLRAVCKAPSVKAPGPGGFTDGALHAALSLAQHDPTKSGSLSGHSAWWPESAWLTSSSYFRNPGNSSLSSAEFCSLRAPVFMRLCERSDDKKLSPSLAPNTCAGHKRQYVYTKTLALSPNFIYSLSGRIKQK